MRNGVLIKEASPEDLLTQENTNSLEEAFLSLSRRQIVNQVITIITTLNIVFNLRPFLFQFSLKIRLKKL